MATATSPKPKDGSPKPSLTMGQKIRYGLYALAGLILLWGIFNFAYFKGQAKLGASYAAHVTCSCRYIAGRTLDSCTKDFEPGMGIISVADDEEHKSITASVPFLAHSVAQRRGDFGCLQLNEAEIDALD